MWILKKPPTKSEENLIRYIFILRPQKCTESTRRSRNVGLCRIDFSSRRTKQCFFVQSSVLMDGDLNNCHGSGFFFLFNTRIPFCLLIPGHLLDVPGSKGTSGPLALLCFLFFTWCTDCIYYIKIGKQYEYWLMQELFGVWHSISLSS